MTTQDQQSVLDALSPEREVWWEAMLVQGEKQMHRLAQERGLRWDQMDEQARLDFVDDLIHEDRDGVSSPRITDIVEQATEENPPLTMEEIDDIVHRTRWMGRLK